MAASDKRFMVDEEILEEIAGFASLSEADSVLEVGGGQGNLTELVSKRSKVYVVEKDKALARGLSGRFKTAGNVTVIPGDALSVEFPRFNKVVANIPYSISRELLERLITHGFDCAVLTVQREFAAKLGAAPFGDNYRMVSVLAQSTCRVENLMEVPAEAFEPRPKVSSSVVRLTQTWKPPKEYIAFLNRLFSGKNKKIRNIMEVPEKYSQLRPVEMAPDVFRQLFKEVEGE